MNLSNVNMTKLFYQIGSILMLIGAGGQSYSLYLNWNLLNVGGKISAVSNICFTLILSIFFYYLLKTTPDMITNISDEEVNKLMEKYKK